MELQIFSFVFLLLLIIPLRASGGERAIGQIRIARNAPPIVNCDGLASNGYSEFNIEELVTIGLDGKPEKDGAIATCGGRCKVHCRGYPGWDVCFGQKITQSSGEWKFKKDATSDTWYIQCKCQHSKVCRKPGRLCGPQGFRPCPADSPVDTDPRPDWIDGFNTGFEDQGLSQGVTSTTPDPDSK